MRENPYQPPATNITSKTLAPGSLWKAVGIGIAIDIGGTVILSLIITVLYGGMLTAEGSSPEDIQVAMAALDPFSPLGIVMSALGLALSVLGGYWCALIANRTTYLAPTLVAVTSLVFSIVMGNSGYSWAMYVFMIGVSVAATYWGASLALRKITQTTTPTTTPK